MKFNKNVLIVILISVTISTASYTMDSGSFTLSKSSQRRARRKAAVVAAKKAAADAVEVTSAQSAVDAADKLAGALDHLKDNLNKERDARTVPQLSWTATFASNKLRAFVGLIVIAEAVDFAQALCKAKKEELQDKTVAQTAQLIAQKTYTAKLLGAAKNGLINRVVPGILDLKQKAQDYINKKKQTA